MQIRRYDPADLDEVVKLFYNTVHIVNAADYTPKQLDAWVPKTMDTSKWAVSLALNSAFVAVEDGINGIIGFGDITADGYLDRLYVRADSIGKGVGKALCRRLESAVCGDITTHASITARPFFEKMGYFVVKKQQVERGCVLLTNFIMKKVR